MDNFSEYLNSGHVWLYVPVAILLGALHGLEPGHSKTMMAAFIIAIRGTIAQAVLLGLSAAVSHSLIIWLLAALALHYGSQWNAETVEPYLQIGSAVMIFGLAVWMYFRTRREVREAAGSNHFHDHSHHGHSHDHLHDHDAPLAGELIATDSSIRPSAKPGHGPNRGMMLDTGHGWLEIAIFEDGTPPRFRIYPCKASGDALPISKGMTLTIETARFDGRTQLFKFEPGDGFWESTAILPEPHEFMATVTLSHDDHAHSYRLRFSEDHHHQTSIVEEMQAEGDVYQDAHERAHAEDIARRFSNRTVTTPQIVLFGITGGLMPCPAAFTILLVCLQLKKAVLGFSIVAAFSFGLALTMVTVGATAAWSVHHAQKRFSGFTEVMRKAPYVSCALLILLAAYMAWSGWQGLHQVHPH